MTRRHSHLLSLHGDFAILRARRRGSNRVTPPMKDPIDHQLDVQILAGQIGEWEFVAIDRGKTKGPDSGRILGHARYAELAAPAARLRTGHHDRRRALS